MRLRCSLPALALAALLAVSACRGRKAAPVGRGDAAPPFALPALTGEVSRFPEGFAGRKGVVLRFWSATCPVCEERMKEFDPVAGRLAASGVAFVAVNVGQERAKVEAIARRLGVGYQFLLDEEAATAKAYGVDALPTTFFVGSDGRVRERVVGETGMDAFEVSARTLTAPPGPP
jgi:cytochrome c biogenesis protein CcmG, thiol:disulfide interchange protein DsbE